MALLRKVEPQPTPESRLKELEALEVRRTAMQDSVREAEQTLRAAKGQAIPPAELERMDDMAILARESHYKREVAKAEGELTKARAELLRYDQANPADQVQAEVQKILAAMAERERLELRQQYRTKLTDILTALEALRKLAGEADVIWLRAIKEFGMEFPIVIPQRGVFPETPNNFHDSPPPPSSILYCSVRAMAAKFDSELATDEVTKSALLSMRKHGQRPSTLTFPGWLA
jgi:multidrug efflux pump subunit AcrA (membrane-fusion protein)